MNALATARFFPDRANLSYRTVGARDPTGGPDPVYTAGATGVPCSIQDSAAIDEDVLRIVGERIDSAVWFAATGPNAADVARLKRGDVLNLTPALGVAAIHQVVRADKMGIGDLQLWQIYTRRRE